MFITDQYNQLPKEILDRIPKLNGQTVKFVVGGKYYDKANKTYRFPYMTAIPKTDRIVDPKTNDVYPIANVHNVSSAGEPVMPMVYFDHTGHIIIRPDENGNYSASDVLNYQYLMLCNYNGTNPHRDKSAKNYFEQVNDDAVAAVRVGEKSLTADAMKAVAQLKDDEVPLLAAQIGVGEIGDQTQVLRLKLVEHAEKEAQKVLSAIEVISNLGEYIAVIEKALEVKAIQLDRRNNTYKWAETKQEFYSAEKGLSQLGAISSLARWFKTTQEGASLFVVLKNSISAHSG